MRKSKRITVNDGGNNLIFDIKQMSVMQSQNWLMRAASVLLDSADGADVIGELSTKGLGAFRGVDVDRLQPLINDLLACVSRVDGAISVPLTPDIVDGMLEDIMSLFALEKEAFNINFGFFGFGGESDTHVSKATEKTTSKQRISTRG